MGFHDLERRSTMDRESSTWNNLTVKVRLHCATGCTTGCATGCTVCKRSASSITMDVLFYLPLFKQITV